MVDVVEEVGMAVTGETEEIACSVTRYIGVGTMGEQLLNLV